MSGSQSMILRLLMVALAGHLFACGGSLTMESPSPPTSPCLSSAACPDDTLCRQGKCVEPPACAWVLDCSDGEVCQGNRCILSPGPCGLQQPIGHCPTGRVCNAGVCVTPTGSGEPIEPSWCQCAAAQGCSDGECVDLSQVALCSASRPTGACIQGSVCVGGQCTPVAPDNRCHPERPMGLCPAGAACVEGFCLPIAEDPCRPKNDDGLCPAGKACVEPGTCKIVPCSADHPFATCTRDPYDARCIDGVCEPFPCGPEATHGYCPSDQFCSAAGACVLEGYCGHDGDCEFDQFCSAQAVCILTDTCLAAADCAEFLACNDQQVCVRTYLCEDDDGCPQDEFCSVKSSCEGSVCARTCLPDGQCSDDIDCGVGTFCAAAGLCIADDTCYDARDCDASQRCGATHVCLNPGQCEASGDCPPGHNCTSTLCEVIGAACVPHYSGDPGGGVTPCPAGQSCCPGAGTHLNPNGADCCGEETQCSAPSACPGGGNDCRTCIPSGACVADADCPTGYQCSESFGCEPESTCPNPTTCETGEYCAQSGGCLPDAGCAPGATGACCFTDLDCTLLGDDGWTCNELHFCEPPTGCGSETFGTTLVEPNMLVVFDRSGSMNMCVSPYKDKACMNEADVQAGTVDCPGDDHISSSDYDHAWEWTRWNVSRTALAEVLSNHDTSVRFGLSTFPHYCLGNEPCGTPLDTEFTCYDRWDRGMNPCDQECVDPGELDVAIDAGNAAAIAASLAPPLGTCQGGDSDGNDCSEDTACPGGSCEPRSPVCVGGADAGDSCSNDDDCTDGSCDRWPQHPGGLTPTGRTLRNIGRQLSTFGLPDPDDEAPRSNFIMLFTDGDANSDGGSYGVCDDVDDDSDCDTIDAGGACDLMPHCFWNDDSSCDAIDDAYCGSQAVEAAPCDAVAGCRWLESACTADFPYRPSLFSGAEDDDKRVNCTLEHLHATASIRTFVVSFQGGSRDKLNCHAVYGGTSRCQSNAAHCATVAAGGSAACIAESCAWASDTCTGDDGYCERFTSQGEGACGSVAACAWVGSACVGDDGHCSIIANGGSSACDAALCRWQSGGCEAVTTDNCYFSRSGVDCFERADSAAELSQKFDTIAGKAASCSYALLDEPEQVENLFVLFDYDCTKLNETTCQSVTGCSWSSACTGSAEPTEVQRDSNGWSYQPGGSSGASQVVFRGAACSTLLAGFAAPRVIYRCAGPGG